MSKAEEKSEQYRAFREQCGIKDPVMLNEIEEAYFEGYHQAEKDLELTWEDAKEIYCIALNLRDHVGSSVFGQPFYEEVLKEFKNYKERKKK